jgi:rhodanese-related sulfurtransferase
MKTMIAACLALALTAVPALAEESEKLEITKGQTSLTIDTADGPVEITRVMTPCALNKGWLQPLVPVEGVRPVSEVEVLEALASGETLVIDMRSIEWRAQATIPGSIHIPYTEVAGRLDELGCTRQDDAWDCANAVSFIGFCNGPVCPQSPMAMKAAVREGFPPEKIGYYRGGMLDWQALGLTTIEGMF